MPCNTVGVSAHEQRAGCDPKARKCTLRLWCKQNLSNSKDALPFRKCNTAEMKSTDSLCNFSPSWYWRASFHSWCTVNKSSLVRTSPETHAHKLLQCIRDGLEHNAGYSVQTTWTQNTKRGFCSLQFLSFHHTAGETQPVYQSCTFKSSRLQESRKLNYDSMIDVSSVNVSGEVYINNTVARSFSQIPEVSWYTSTSHRQCWLKCIKEGLFFFIWKQHAQTQSWFGEMFYCVCVCFEV